MSPSISMGQERHFIDIHKKLVSYEVQFSPGPDDSNLCDLEDEDTFPSLEPESKLSMEKERPIPSIKIELISDVDDTYTIIAFDEEEPKSNKAALALSSPPLDFESTKKRDSSWDFIGLGDLDSINEIKEDQIELSYLQRQILNYFPFLTAVLLLSVTIAIGMLMITLCIPVGNSSCYNFVFFDGGFCTSERKNPFVMNPVVNRPTLTVRILKIGMMTANIMALLNNVMYIILCVLSIYLEVSTWKPPPLEIQYK